MSTTSALRSLLNRAWKSAPFVLAALALVHPLATLLARHDWRLDLVTHFQEPALAITLLALIAALWRHRRLAICLGLLAATQLAPVLRYAGSNPVAADVRSNERLRVVMANVLERNHNYELLERLIRDERPDVVGLVEVTPAWIKGLEAARREFPYRVELAVGSRGMAFWFRKAPRSLDAPEVLAPPGNPVAHATLLLGGKVRHLWLVHPSNPLSERGRYSSNGELAALAERIRRTPGSHVVFGDLNRTDGSPYFHDFQRAAGLRDSRLGFGRQPSWPVGSPYQIAIDHAFLSPDLAVTERRLGPNIGSDHRPLVLEIAPASPPSAARSAADKVSHATASH
jgi:endonuclease/exonuclease/phosphatase (EEP) superfamily protein YafD